MKMIRIFLMLAVTVLSSISLSAQDYRVINRDEYRYEGEWPKGYGALYSYKEGLIIGTFHRTKPDGKCVCYKPNGDVYWGDYKRGKAIGKGRIYRDNGIVITGDYKNGKCHGIDTLFRSDGSTAIFKCRNGKLKGIIHHEDDSPESGMIRINRPPVAEKPAYPMVDLRPRQEEFLRELELIEEERYFVIMKKHGVTLPSFQGGSIDDFALWVNSQVTYPDQANPRGEPRTVIVEFIVRMDGSVTDVHTIFGTDPLLNEEAEKVVASSPCWIPGEQNGEKKNVRMSVQVVFNP